jgi:hypothetical protein
MLATEAAILVEFELTGCSFLVLGGCVVSLLALGARKGDDVSHWIIPLNVTIGADLTNPPL